jgi:hypothetical protein
MRIEEKNAIVVEDIVIDQIYHECAFAHPWLSQDVEAGAAFNITDVYVLPVLVAA